MPQGYDIDQALPRLGARTDTRTLFAQTMGLVAVTTGLFGFGLLVGAATAPTIADYAGADPQAVWEAGGATALFVAGFGVLALFVSIPAGAVIYALLGLVIFAGLVLYDFQRLRASTQLDSAPLLAASIFLDILNVFQFFRTLFGRTRQ